jgi:hypothetical protein
VTRSAAADPYAAMTDVQVLARVAAALRKVPEFPVGSIQRGLQWALYESAKAELDQRMFLHVAARLGRQPR